MTTIPQQQQQQLAQQQQQAAYGMYTAQPFAYTAPTAAYSGTLATDVGGDNSQQMQQQQMQLQQQQMQQMQQLQQQQQQQLLQQQQLGQQQQQQQGQAGGAAPTSSTLCLRNLPPDITRRELRLLVVLLPGYDEVSVSKTGLGFVKFWSPDAAAAAFSRLAGLLLDSDVPGSVLTVEYAKRDLYAEKPYPGQGGGQSGYGNQGGYFGGGGREGGRDSRNKRARVPAENAWGNKKDAKGEKEGEEKEKCRDTLCLMKVPMVSKNTVLELLAPLAPAQTTFPKCTNDLDGGVAQEMKIVFVRFDTEAAASTAIASLGNTKIQDVQGVEHDLLVEYAHRTTTVRAKVAPPAE